MQGRLQRLPREERQLNSGLCHQHRVLRLPVDVEASHRSDQHGGQCAREPGEKNGSVTFPMIEFQNITGFITRAECLLILSQISNIIYLPHFSS